jgi:hypothetical protein
VSSGSTQPKTSRIRRRKLFVVLLVAAIAGTALLLSAYAARISGLGTCGSPAVDEPSSIHFSLVISFDGYNGSEHHIIPWPMLNATLRQDVMIDVWNNDTQAHSFAITHYFEPGEYIQPNQSYSLTFQSCQSGSFTVYDPSFVTTYPYLKAELHVTP